jgi:hypothetical protein
MGLWFTSEYLVEITFMPIDVAKAYFEIQRLRREVRKAELALRLFFARPPNRPRHTGHTNARASQATNPQMPVFKTRPELTAWGWAGSCITASLLPRPGWVQPATENRFQRAS